MVSEDVAMTGQHSVLNNLDVALNESDVVGLRWAPADSLLLLLQVLALPAEGPVDPDNRRALLLAGVSRVRVLLRRELTGPQPYGPAVPLSDLEAVDRFFASLTRSGSMYGWKFLDAPDLVGDWPRELSLDLSLAPAPARHSLYWFNECGRDEADGEHVAYCVEGVVDFEDLAVQRPDGSPIPLADFVAAGRRWWQAFRDGDPRVSASVQVAVSKPPSWRS